jgi:hypothetical protein
LRDKILSFSFRKPFNFISSFVPTSSGQARQKKSFCISTAEGGRLETTSLFKKSGLNQNWLPGRGKNPNFFRNLHLSLSKHEEKQAISAILLA